MGKSSKQKNKKAEKRKKRSALKKKAATKAKIRRVAIEKRLREYPNFHYKDYDKESVSAEFVEEVKQVLNNFNFNDSTILTPLLKYFYKEISHLKRSTHINRVAIKLIS